MGWTIENFIWPDSLKKKTYSKADETKEIENLLGYLNLAEKEHQNIESSFSFPEGKNSRDKAIAWGENTQKFFTTTAKKLIGSLKVIKANCENIQKDKKAYKKLSKDTRKAVKAISEAVADHLQSIDPKVIGVQISKSVADQIKANREHVLKNMKPVFAACKACSSKNHPKLAAAAATLDNWDDGDTETQKKVRGDFGDSLQGGCRDMTQNFQNLQKIIAEGVDLTKFGLSKVDITSIGTVMDILLPYANPKSLNKLIGKYDKKGLYMLISNIRAQSQIFDQISGRLLTS